MSGKQQGTALLIRPCGRKDLANVQRILELSPEAAVWSQVALEEALTHCSVHFLVVIYQEQISGFVIGRHIAGEAEILNLAVHPQSRRRGLATALAKAFLEVCACEEAVKVFLEVRESNGPAISFYRRLGFNLTGRRPAYYTAPAEAALLLSMELPARS